MKTNNKSLELTFTGLVQLVRDELNTHSKDGDIGYNKAAQAVDKAIMPHFIAWAESLVPLKPRIVDEYDKGWDKCRSQFLTNLNKERDK